MVLKEAHVNRRRMGLYSDLGQNLNELAIIFGLVALTVFGAFYSMGPEIKKLFASSKDEITKSTESVTVAAGSGNDRRSDPNSGGNNETGGNGSTPPTSLQQYESLPKFKYEITFDPSTQMAQIVTQESVSAGTNTTSSLGEHDSFVAQVDTGQASNVGKTLRMAEILQGMANNEPDLNAKAYFQQLAQVSYYLGAVQGELDDVNGLDLNPSVLKAYGGKDERDYTNADALRDLVGYSASLRTLLQNQPQGVDPARRALAMSLGREVFKLAEKYQMAHAQFLDSQGFANGENWANDENCEELETCEMNGFFGKSFKSAKNTKYGEQHKTQGWQYDQLVPYDALMKTSAKVLAAANKPLDNIKIVLFKIEGLAKDGDANTKDDKG
jgi:hypothetical protein